MLSETLPLVRCKKCGIGTMLPLSDYGQDGAAILYKAWVCNNRPAATTSASTGTR